MPIQLAGACVLGPFPAAAPTTLVPFLTSVGKASWYGRWLASFGLAPNSDGSGGAVGDGGAWGCWAPIEQLSFNFKFVQATSASRPAFGVSRDGTPGVYGNTSSWFAALDSTTALNGSYTVLAAIWTPAETGYVMSQSSTVHGLGNATNYQHSIRVANALAPATPQSRTASLSGSGARTKIGWTVTGVGHNGNAMNLLRRSNGADYSASTIYELCFCPALTASEISKALQYLV